VKGRQPQPRVGSLAPTPDASAHRLISSNNDDKTVAIKPNVNKRLICSTDDMNKERSKVRDDTSVAVSSQTTIRKEVIC